MTLRTYPLALLLLFAFPLTGQGTLMQTASTSEIEVENCARINDEKIQFGPAIYGDELVFLTRPRAGYVDPVTKEIYFQLFRSSLSPDGEPGRKKRFSIELNSGYNAGPVSFTQEDRVIFFTRTQLTEGTTTEDRTGKANLGIYSAYRAEYDWAGVRPLPFNGTNFSNQHPTVTPNGRRVFFASNREGGYGGYDLYFSDFRDGRWSAAVNLGPEVNTEGNEAFPHIHPSGRLLFASNGHGGQGGFDLFMIDLSERRWGNLINLPAPINSSADDVGIVLTANGNRGYLVSNRSDGLGKDDIYLLRMRRGFTSLEGPRIDGATFTLYDGANSRRVANARVWLGEVNPAGRLPTDYYTFSLEDRTGGKQIVPTLRSVGQLPPTPLRTDREGSLRLELAIGKTYELVVHKNGYAPAALRFVYAQDGPSRPLAITLQPNDCRIVSGRITDRKGGGIEGMPVRFQSPTCAGAGRSAMTDVTGNFEVCLPTSCNYRVTAGRAGYETGVADLTTDQLLASDRPVFSMALRPEGNVSRPGGASNEAVLPLPGLSFFDGTGILREENSKDINLLQSFLLSRPDTKLLLVSHTDGPKTPDYLVRLGEQRAEAVRQALLRRGIARNRLRTIAYGNTYRAKQCAPCSAADYAANNRMEAKVVNW